MKIFQTDIEPGTLSGVTGVPSGSEVLVLAEIASVGLDVLFVARDDLGLARTAAALAFFAPAVDCLEFPAWDCLPYDRVSPLGGIVGQRLYVWISWSVGIVRRPAALC